MAMDRMSTFADEINLKNKADVGHPTEFLDAIKMANFKKIASQGKGAMDQGMMGAFNRGMQYSGASTIKQPADIQAGMVGQAMDVEMNVWQENEQYKMSMLQQYLGVLQHQDSMDLAQAQIDAQKTDLIDQITSFAAAVGSFV